MNLTPTSYSSTYGGIPTLPTSGDLTQLLKTGMNSAIPGFDKLTNKATRNTDQMLSGKLPSDVQRQIQDSGAAWGINMGSPGSPLVGSRNLQLVGKNSLAMQQQGQQDLLQMLQGYSGTMTPNAQQTGDLTTAQAQYNAAPNPQNAAEQMMNFLREQADKASKSNLDAIALTNQRFSELNKPQNPASGGARSWSMSPVVNSAFSPSFSGGTQAYWDAVNRSRTPNRYSVW